MARVTGKGESWTNSVSHTCQLGEGNGNPLQLSCLENPVDGEAWWAAVRGVAQSQTRLKRLSSSSRCQLSHKPRAAAVPLLRRALLLVTPWTDCSPSGSSVHGILQARILEWVAISFSRGSSWPRDWTFISCIERQILYCLNHKGSLCLLVQSCPTFHNPMDWLQPTRLLCPWYFPGQNTELGCHFLLQGIFLNQGSNLHLLHWQADSLPLTPWEAFRSVAWGTQFVSS